MVCKSPETGYRKGTACVDCHLVTIDISITLFTCSARIEAPRSVSFRREKPRTSGAQREAAPFHATPMPFFLSDFQSTYPIVQEILYKDGRRELDIFLTESQCGRVWSRFYSSLLRG